jgi:RNA polymerase sigma factor (sigma-70 family)
METESKSVKNNLSSADYHEIVHALFCCNKTFTIASLYSMKQKHLLKQLSAFFRSEYRRMVGYVRSLIDDAAERDSEDIVQDVMAAVFAKAEVTIPIENLAGYVYQALRNRIVDTLRRRKTPLSLDSPVHGSEDPMTLLEVLADKHADSSSRVETRQVHDRIVLAMERLSPQERAVVMATEIDDRSFKELCEEWHIPMGTLLARKSRAMEKLRHLINNETI